MSHVMLDLETLGNDSDAVIISIGAVHFIPATSQIGRKFEVLVDPQSCVDCGLRMTASTIMWWMKQDAAARAQFDKPNVALPQALGMFNTFLNSVGNASDIKIWGNGATFDNVILSTAYRAAKMERPWKYYNNLCYRTFKKLYPGVQQDKIGISHRAVDDAEYQARLLMKIFVQAGLKNV